MGGQRDGRFVSGLGLALAAGTNAAPPPALSASVNFTGPSTLNVSGASGSASPSGGVNLVSVIISGGTPPYTGTGPAGVTVFIGDDPSGKIGLTASGDAIHLTPCWSGFALNELESFTLRLSVVDDAGTSASARYPDSGVLVIKRTS